MVLGAVNGLDCFTGVDGVAAVVAELKTLLPWYTVDVILFSTGLKDGFQVGLWRPAEGDLVGAPARYHQSISPI